MGVYLNRDINRTKLIAKVNTYHIEIIMVLLFLISRLMFINRPFGYFSNFVVKEVERSYEAYHVSLYFVFRYFGYYQLSLKVFYVILGYHVWVGRLFSLICSLITMVYIYRITHLLSGRRAAIFSMFFYLVSPYNLYLNVGIIRENQIFMFLTMSFYYLMLYYNDDSITNFKESIDNLNFRLSFIFFGLAVLFKFTSLYFIIVFGTIFIVKSKIYSNPKVLASIAVVSIIIPVLVILYSNQFFENRSFLFFNNPSYLIDTNWYWRIEANITASFPFTTFYLGLLGVLFTRTKLQLSNVLWLVSSTLIIFVYGYGAIVHPYYVMYFFIPTILLASNLTSILIAKINEEIISLNNIETIEYNNFKLSKAQIESFLRIIVVISLILILSIHPVRYNVVKQREVENSIPIAEAVRETAEYIRSQLDPDDFNILTILTSNESPWWEYFIIALKGYLPDYEYGELNLENILQKNPNHFRQGVYKNNLLVFFDLYLDVPNGPTTMDPEIYLYYQVFFTDPDGDLRRLVIYYNPVTS